MSGVGGGLPLPSTANKAGRNRVGGWAPLENLKAFRSHGVNTPSSKRASSTSSPSSSPTPVQQGTAHPKSLMEPLGRIMVPRDELEAEVLNALKIHKRFSMPSIAPGLEVTDLPNFDDVTAYGVTEDAQEKLWDLEAKRLVEAVTQENPLLFEGSQQLDVDSKKAYALLAILADRVMQCLYISIYDGENLLAEHHQGRCSKRELQKCKMMLSLLVDIEDDAGETQKEGESEGNNGGATKKTEDLKVNEGDVFKFVDYCTSVAARVLCSAVDGRYFHASILAHMAKLCTKIKVLSADHKKYAEVSLVNGEAGRYIHVPKQPGIRGYRDTPNSTEDSFMHSLSGGMDSFIARMEAENKDQMEPLEKASKKKALRIRYCEKCDTYRTGITRMLRHIVVHLRGTNQLTQTFPTSYEISEMIYETGFESAQTMVFQDEENAFVGTSDAVVVNYCRNGIHILNQTLEFLHQRGMKARCDADPSSPQTIVLDDASSITTTVSWDYTPDTSSSRQLAVSQTKGTSQRLVKVGSMSKVITIIVPMLLANPAVGVLMRYFLNVISFNSFLSERSETTTEQNQSSRPDSRFSPRTYGNYTAFVSLTTEEYRLGQRSRPPGAPRSLSNALMRRNNLHKGSELGKLPRADTIDLASLQRLQNQGIANVQALPDDEDTLQRRIEAHRQELNHYSASMSSWVYEEKGVMVQCKTYVALTMLFCAVLVGGGIAVGVTVGPRITAVDPFNITTYCWVLAAFVVLVAKSVRVHEWPWNDFLYGRVRCQSVSELSSVTGIPDRLILAKLLQDESLSRLETRGPFNAVFRRRSSDGFSIDRPISMWTMLLSGLIMIEVEAVGGKKLVCLDVRRGTLIQRISHMEEQEDERKRKSYIHCKHIPGKDGISAEDNPAHTKLVLDFGEDIQWMRSLGFYSNKDAMFV
ncbi:hypothetical protein QBC45DRAFT_79149 [Copromyces sp. CBS 386.78]|nr:hypothetical protein QBC45DRAFT_79149 [Copromyces sp. CBS 386.78]